MFKDETCQIVPAIVSEEVWDRANEILKRRSEDVKDGMASATIPICSPESSGAATAVSPTIPGNPRIGPAEKTASGSARQDQKRR